MTNVDEPVQVAMLFRGSEVRPAAFMWHGHRYEVVKVLLIHKTRLGSDLRWHFTITTNGGGTARLAFDTLSLAWQLEAFEGAA